MTKETIRKLRNVAAEAERCGSLINLEPWELNELLDSIEVDDADTLPPESGQEPSWQGVPR